MPFQRLGAAGLHRQLTSPQLVPARQAGLAPGLAPAAALGDMLEWSLSKASPTFHADGMRSNPKAAAENTRQQPGSAGSETYPAREGFQPKGIGPWAQHAKLWQTTFCLPAGPQALEDAFNEQSVDQLKDQPFAPLVCSAHLPTSSERL